MMKALFSLLWLLCLTAWCDEWHEQTGARWKNLQVTASEPGFNLLGSAVTGIRFTNMLDDRISITNRNLLSGSGVALGDVDGDGRCDIYLCALTGGNRLYRNLGAWKFEDITSSSGTECPGQFSTGATLADVDADGDLDLLVNSLGKGTRLFLNDGAGHFKEATEAAGLASRSGATSLTLADFDMDGDLDLYVCHFRPQTILDQPGAVFRTEQRNGQMVVAFVNGRPTTDPDLADRFVVGRNGEVLELGEVDGFFRNDGQGHFARVSFTDGTFLDEEGRPLSEAPHDWGLAAQFRDIDQDGKPDLYVCNDLFTPDRIWMNQGKGVFRAMSVRALRSNSTFSMGVDFADINRDGFVDLFTVDMLSRHHRSRMTQVAAEMRRQPPPGVIDYRMQQPRNTLHVNRGDNTFAEIAFFSGVDASEWSWGPTFIDVDMDGYEDILIPNGQLRDFQNGDIAQALESLKSGSGFSFERAREMLDRFPGLHTPNVAFRNRRDLTFEEVGERWGFATPGIAQGMAMADLDNDGDMDVVVNNLKSAAGVYQNKGGGNRVAVRLRGVSANRFGIGARLYLHGGAVPEQYQEMICGGRYLSGDEAMRVFAAGDDSHEMSLTVAWPSGKQSTILGIRGNRLYEVFETEASLESGRPSTLKPLEPGIPMFSDVSPLLNSGHVDEPFDDFASQSLLSRKLSQWGPGLMWADLNEDGWDDLVAGSGRGGLLGVFYSEKGTGFAAFKEAPVNRPVGRDLTGLLGFNGAVLAGSSNWEDGQTNGGAVRLYDFRRKAGGEIVLGVESSTGPLSAADVDNDGDLDLFIGGRAISGRYPQPGISKLMRNDGGRFVLVQRFEDLGMVNGCVFGDLDGDGDPDLVVACDWGNVKVLFNERGHFVEKDVGLTEFKGWWNGVALGDFDEDGRLDVVASNWGLNHPNPATPSQIRHLYYGDLRGTGHYDLIESRWDSELRAEVPERGLRLLAGALPFVRESAATFSDYANASLSQLFGDRLADMKRLDANWMETSLFLNRGNRFVRQTMPREAQWSPAFGIGVADLDGDGHEDLVLAQNFFAVASDGWRQDAGRGLVLRGDGKGGFVALLQSGLTAYGEGRGLALGDFNADGRWDVAIGQNSATLRLYQNQSATPGIRVRFQGAAGNLSMIGTRFRTQAQGHWGAMRELHAGQGYGSQDSATQILSCSPRPELLGICPPGSTRWVTNQIPVGTMEIIVTASGALKTAGP